MQAQGYFRMTENMGSDEARPPRPPYLPAWLKAARPLSPFLGLFTPDHPTTPFFLFADRPPFSIFLHEVNEARPFFSSLPLPLRLPFFNPISSLIFSLLTFCCLSRSLCARSASSPRSPGTFYLGMLPRTPSSSESEGEGIRGHKRTR